jgi:hypothetical protein
VVLAVVVVAAIVLVTTERLEPLIKVTQVEMVCRKAALAPLVAAVVLALLAQMARAELRETVARV